MKKLIKKFKEQLDDNFPKYEILEEKCVSYLDADKLMRSCNNDDDTTKHWVISDLEDINKAYGWVWICRKKKVKR